MAVGPRIERTRLPLAVALAIAAGAMAADIALDALWHGATLYLERCATSSAWRDPVIFWWWVGDHLRAFPVSSAAMMLGCGWPCATTRSETAGMALRIAAMVVAMPVLCELGLQAAAALPPTWQVAAYLATMWLLSLGMDRGLRHAAGTGMVRRVGWR